MNNDPKYKQDLSFYFKDLNDPKIQVTTDNALHGATALEKEFKGKINVPEITPDKILRLIQEMEEINTLTNTVTMYSFLIYAADTTNEKARAFGDKMMKFHSNIEKSLSFVNIELGLALKSYPELLSGPLLETYTNYLDSIFLTDRYRSEQLFAFYR